MALIEANSRVKVSIPTFLNYDIAKWNQLINKLIEIVPDWI